MTIHQFWAAIVVAQVTTLKTMKLSEEDQQRFYDLMVMNVKNEIKKYETN